MPETLGDMVEIRRLTPGAPREMQQRERDQRVHDDDVEPPTHGQKTALIAVSTSATDGASRRLPTFTALPGASTPVAAGSVAK